MEQSASFSGKEVDSVSLDFSELHEMGLAYIQELSGDVWTDYNSHDPGVTILEQLCYSLTDIANRISLPVEDLLTTEKDDQPNMIINAFLPPSSILTSLPVTIDDTRKMIIDRFDEIQNVWIAIKENVGYEEALRGINRIEILPKISFLKKMVGKPQIKIDFLDEVNKFLRENRNLGEFYEDALLLEPQDINISFKVYINEDAELEITIARLFLQLLEYVYNPIQYSTFGEMKDAGYSMEELYSGPKLIRGFIKDDHLKYEQKSIQAKRPGKNDINKKRLNSIHVDDLQKILSKVDGINRCELSPFIIDDKKQTEVKVENGKFFHLLQIDQSSNLTDNRFARIYQNMTVFVDGKKLSILNNQKINSLFSETWSKKYRAYPIESSVTEFLNDKLQGTYRNPTEYYSLQRHFPLIYGIGEEGLSKNEPVERHAKALQLKAYLMLFEQHLANHLAQLGNLNEFFNIDFRNGQEKTYFTQWMDSVPQIEKLATGDMTNIEACLESKAIFYNRKNRIYNHLLSRFGEEISDIPWKIAFRLNLIENEDEFNRTLLQYKSDFLLNLENLSYYRTRGEYFQSQKTGDDNLKYQRHPSGLEKIILAKTGIPEREKHFLVPDFAGSNEQSDPDNESSFNFKEIGDLNNNFRQLLPDEINRSYPTAGFIIPMAMFNEFDLKVLFKETLNFKNYRISNPDSAGNNVQVVFQKGKNKWVNLFTSRTNEKAIQRINQIINFFLSQNKKSEGLYVVDHILLSDILKDSKYGFKFTDEHGEPLFQTDEEESWYHSEDDRNVRFSEIKLKKAYYFFDNGKWMIQHKNWIHYPDITTNPKLDKLSDELKNGHFSCSNGKWIIKYEDSSRVSEQLKNKDLEILNELLEEVYENTNSFNSQIRIALDKNSYSFSNGKWILNYEDKILASFKIKDEDLVKLNEVLGKYSYSFTNGEWKINDGVEIPFDNTKNLEILNTEFEKVFKNTRSIIQLFNMPDDENGRLRFSEMEKIRAKGSMGTQSGQYGQRRLIFQRKLSNGDIIDEDFFNLMITVLLPDWPARFQTERFKDYVNDLIYERLPSHISNEIVWVDTLNMKRFEEKFYQWEQSKYTGKPSGEVQAAALDVYHAIMDLRKN
ncbi:MAG TPA: hypothetical protein VFC65_20390 [Prolixibacteraceae bacterium]|nr:hypothetical protein [Prolixibacteraceae bacterium]